MRHYKRRRWNLEAEHALHCRALDLLRRERIAAFFAKGFRDPVKDLDQVGTRAAARIEHIDIWGGETVGKMKFLAQHLIDERDHIAHDFAWRVPNAKLLAEFLVVSFAKCEGSLPTDSWPLPLRWESSISARSTIQPGVDGARLVRVPAPLSRCGTGSKARMPSGS